MNYLRFSIQFLYSIHFLKSRSKLSFYSQLKSRRLLFGDHENVLIFTAVFFFFFFACVLSHAHLFTTLWTVAHQAPLSMGFPRQEYWNGLPFPSLGEIPDPGIKLAYPASPTSTSRFFTTDPSGESKSTVVIVTNYWITYTINGLTVWYVKYILIREPYLNKAITKKKKEKSSLPCNSH